VSARYIKQLIQETKFFQLTSYSVRTEKRLFDLSHGFRASSACSKY